MSRVGEPPTPLTSLTPSTTVVHVTAPVNECEYALPAHLDPALCRLDWVDKLPASAPWRVGVLSMMVLEERALHTVAADLGVGVSSTFLLPGRGSEAVAQFIPGLGTHVKLDQSLGRGADKRVRVGALIARGEQGVEVQYVACAERSLSNPTRAARAKREIETLRLVEESPHFHKPLATLLEHDDGGGLVSVATLSPIRAGDLGRCLEDGRLQDERRLAKISLSAVEPVAFLHSRGLAHLDLKLENYLFEPRDSAAPAKLSDLDTVHDVPARESLFTPSYSSRELAREWVRATLVGQEPWRGQADDVKAFGICLYRLATGGRFPEEIERVERDYPLGGPEAVWALALAPPVSPVERQAQRPSGEGVAVKLFDTAVSIIDAPPERTPSIFEVRRRLEAELGERLMDRSPTPPPARISRAPEPVAPRRRRPGRTSAQPPLRAPSWRSASPLTACIEAIPAPGASRSVPRSD